MLTKNKIIEKVKNARQSRGKITLIITVVLLPSGALETIVNYHNLDEKIEYILNAYNDILILKTNPSIELVDCIIL